MPRTNPVLLNTTSCAAVALPAAKPPSTGGDWMSDARVG
jgi:hypothetical protein